MIFFVIKIDTTVGIQGNMLKMLRIRYPCMFAFEYCFHCYDILFPKVIILWTENSCSWMH